MPLIRTSLVLAVIALAVSPPAADATTVKIKSGTTTLTFGQPAIQQLTGMGIGFAPTAPATAAGPALIFPITGGKLKVVKQKVTGTITHGGGMTLSNPALSIALTNPVVALAGRQSALNATTSFGGGAG